MIYHISVHELFMGVKRTTFEGIPSTRINRRIFLVASSMSVADRDLTAVLYWMRILLKECAVCCADGSEEVAMGERRGGGGYAQTESAPQLAFSAIEPPPTATAT